LAPGDPACEETERRLAAQPLIAAPTIVLHGSDNGVTPAAVSEDHARFFGGAYERRVIPVTGHNLPQEAPSDFAAAVLSLL
jgi:pimeloyl-ACP methyl ester carboxylesterase